ncbi:NACHT domain-containing protein [Actinomadura spongiicola]|uniref:NACHT domain-containing protein n=1 Tax=Actinomadura spongiicola TaxID=2303421 RepID=A0A372GLV5_9ACTN|nr:NACHT domain-containing protein [Actinomadura spongiicola]RFS86053.1 NACHT domain-containing protein [Actinomadura spongiicola]
MGRALVVASLAVAAGVAVNQIFNNGKTSWSWGYLALTFTVLGLLMQMTQTTQTTTPPPPEPPTTPPPETTRHARWARRAYLRRMRSSVDQMETVGLITQAEFVLRTRQVYVDVMLQPKPVTDTVTDSGIGPSPPGAAGRRAPLASFLEPGRVLAVLGAAGSGKTTLARYTALELAEQGWWGPGLLPVLLYLRDHAEAIQGEQPDNLARIAAAAPWLDDAVPAEWLERRLARGRCVVLLDGLDEVADADARRRVVRWVEDQISRYPGNAFVVTSRPLGYEGNRLSRADVLHVQRFTSQQIQAFLNTWYRAIEHRSREGDPQQIDRIAARDAADLFQRISGRPALYDLAANPMLLTMIANVHRYRAGSLPGSRAALYEEVCKVLLHRRQEAKGLSDAELEGLSGERKERIVQELAWYMMRHHLRDIPVANAERAIRTVLRRTAPNLTPQAFLNHVRRSGLLLEHQHGRYGFAHLTLQEYLAAALVPGHSTRRQVLVDNVDDVWWREVTLLWAARADAGPVVEACLAVRTVTALNLAFSCASEARELDPALRADLDRLLTTEPSDPDEIRLLDGVAAARALHDTRALDDNGTRICVNPAGPGDLWNRYVQHGEGNGAVWTRNIKGFLGWLNSLFSDGTNYRLPTLAEARLALDSGLHPADTTILYAADEDWGSDHAQAHLVLGTAVRDPYSPTRRQLDVYPNLIVEHTRLIRRVLSSQVPFGHLLAYARPRDLNDPRHRLLHIVDLAFEIACDVAHGRTMALAALAPGFRFRWDSEGRYDADFVRELVKDLDRALDYPRLEGDVLPFIFRNAAELGVVRRQAEYSFPSAFDLAIADVLKLAERIEDVDSLHADIGALAQAYAHDRTYPRTGRDPDHLSAFSALFLRLLTREAETRRLTSEPRPHLDFTAPFRGADLDDDPDRFLDHARYRDDVALRTRGSAWFIEDPAVMAIAEGVPDLIHGLNLASDLANARALAASDVCSRPASAVLGIGAACHELMRELYRLLEPPDSSYPPDTRLFAGFLEAQLSASAGEPPADDPAMALERALRMAASLDERVAERMISTALAYAAPLWDGSRPVRQSDLVLAVTATLAAAPLHQELTPLLHGALRTLIALTPDTDREPEHATLVLVRN